MSYAAEISKTLAETLARFVTLNPHQLAGQAANLDFWIAEVNHCTEVVSGYGKRFETMRAAQTRYVSENHTTEISFDPDCECFACSPRERAKPPKRISDAEMKESLRTVREAAYRFLVRCYKSGYIDERRFHEVSDSIGTSVDMRDLNL